MLNEITTFFHGLLETQMSGAVILAWALGVMSYIVRNVPLKIYAIINKRMTVKFSYPNYTYDMMSIKKYSVIGTFYDTYGIFKKHAGVFNTTSGHSMHEYSFGERVPYHLSHNNNYYFWFNGKLGKIVKNRLESSGVYFEKEELWFTIYFGNKDDMDVVEQWLKDKSHELSNISNSGLLYLYNHKMNSDDVLNKIQKTIRVKHIDSLVINTDKYGHCSTYKLIDDLKKFQQSKELRLQKCLTFKKTILFHGKPGTGKTSLVNVIANQLNCSIFAFNSIEHFSKHISSKNADDEMQILLLDEVDTYRESSKENTAGRDLKGELLLTLDGVDSVSNAIIILCTNHIEKLDKAILRPGRIDDIIEILYWGIDDLNSYLKYMLDGTLVFDKENYYHLDGLIQPAKIHSIVEQYNLNSSKINNEILLYFRELEKQ